MKVSYAFRYSYECNDLKRLRKTHVPRGSFVSIISLPELEILCTDEELVDQCSTEKAKLIEEDSDLIYHSAHVEFRSR